MLELPTARDAALVGLNRLERLAYLLGHDRDGNPLPPEPPRERVEPGPPPVPGRDFPTWQQMKAVLDRAAERDRRREARRVAREHPTVPLHRQLVMFEEERR